MDPQNLIRRLHRYAGVDTDAEPDPESLIGFFQSFRPEGAGLEGLFDGVDVGDALSDRLAQLYRAGGDDRRPDGGRDAYFVIRNPPAVPPDQVEQWGRAWLLGIDSVARKVGAENVTRVLSSSPTIRVLEGIAPKHPRSASERSRLLRTIAGEATEMVTRIPAGPLPAALRAAYYFTACDAMLRDYLMWPFYAIPTQLDDPYAPYFQLWRHGIKYRIFGESQIDFYIPRRVD